MADSAANKYIHSISVHLLALSMYVQSNIRSHSLLSYAITNYNHRYIHICMYEICGFIEC